MLRHMGWGVLGVGVLSAISLTGCGGGGGPVLPSGGSAGEVSFSRQIQPIFDGSCALANCHGSQGARADLTLTADMAYGELVNVPSSQNNQWIRVVPFKPDESLVYLKLTQDRPPVGQKMPPGGGLSADQIALVRDWIRQGARNN